MSGPRRSTLMMALAFCLSGLLVFACWKTLEPTSDHAASHPVEADDGLLAQAVADARDCWTYRTTLRVFRPNTTSLICVVGQTDQAMLKALISTDPKASDVLVVTSTGGDVSAALKMAERIHTLRSSLVVSGLCLSSCANYLFLSAKEKVVLPGAVVGFHGGPIRLATIPYAGPPRSYRAAYNHYATWIDTLLEEQRELFDSVGVQARLIYWPPPGFALGGADPRTVFWVYSRSMLEEAGVRDIAYYAIPHQPSVWNVPSDEFGGVRCRKLVSPAWQCRAGMFDGVFGGFPADRSGVDAATAPQLAGKHGRP